MQPFGHFCILVKTTTMRNLRFALLFMATFSLFFTCSDDNRMPINQIIDNDDDEANAFLQYFGTPISRTFLGTVMDTNHDPIPDATITIGNATAQTDANGVFIIPDATVYERFGYIKTEKEGYITSSRSVVPSEGTNKVSIILLEESIAGTVSSGSEETVALPNGASVKLPGTYVTDSGTAYSGNVNVVLHLLDPVDDDMPVQMPGMLYGANANNEERMLQSYGMLAVELLGDSGEKLNLADGSTAEITVPLDTSLQADAPATIPLWYFNETYGYWEEEGEATLVGTNYVGTVSHFSFWNCDIPAEAVNLCLNVMDADGNPLSNLNISITSANYGTTYGYTNELGQDCGLVPSNETLELNIYNYDMCGTTSLYTLSIGSYSSDSSEDITITTLPSDVISETVTGTFNTCNDDPVTDGYVFLFYQYQTHSTLIDDGTFEFNLLRCDQDDTFSVIGNDYANLQITDTLNYTFTTPLTNIGTISACNTVNEFIQYTIDDGNTEELTILGNIDASFSENNPNYNAPVLIIQGSSTNCFYMFGLLDNSPFLGSYDEYDWNTTGDTGFNIQECIDINSNINITYNLNNLGDVGGYIDINFNGTYDDSQGNPHTINGVIHVIRDN